jgi:hypothetical protein
MKFFRYVKSVVLVVMSPNFPHLSALKFSKLTSYFIICSGSCPFKIRLPHFVVYLRNFILHNYHPPRSPALLQVNMYRVNNYYAVGVSFHTSMHDNELFVLLLRAYITVFMRAFG